MMISRILNVVILAVVCCLVSNEISAQEKSVTGDLIQESPSKNVKRMRGKAETINYWTVFNFPRSACNRFELIVGATTSVTKDDDFDGGLSIVVLKRRLRSEHAVTAMTLGVYQSGMIDFYLGERWYKEKIGAKNQMFLGAGLLTKFYLGDTDVVALGGKVSAGIELGDFCVELGMGMPVLGEMAHGKTYFEGTFGFGLKF